jgi:hypothetical protein
MFVGVVLRQSNCFHQWTPYLISPSNPTVYVSQTILNFQNQPSKAATCVSLSISSTSSIDQNSKDASSSFGLDEGPSLQSTKNRKAKLKSPSATYESPKAKIKAMFKQAQEMERSGRWRQAALVFRRILDLDPHDAHSYLALARLEARREQQPCLNEDLQQKTLHQQELISGSTPTDDACDVSDSKARRAFTEGTQACPKSGAYGAAKPW